MGGKDLKIVIAYANSLHGVPNATITQFILLNLRKQQGIAP